MKSFRLALRTLVATALLGLAHSSPATELFHFTFDGFLSGTTYTNDSASTKTATVVADNNGHYPFPAGGALSFTNDNNSSSLSDEILTVDIGSVAQQQSFILELMINPFSTTQGTANTGNLATLMGWPQSLDLRFNGGTGAGQLEGWVYNGSTWFGTTSTAAIAANQDTHVALVYTDGLTANLQLYINGIATGSAITNRIASGNNALDMGIGNLGVGTRQARGFDGLIKEAALSTFTGPFDPSLFVVAIPESNSLALVLGGLLLLATSRRARRSHH